MLFMTGRGLLFQRADPLLQGIVGFLQLDEVQRQLLNFPEQHGLHGSQLQAVGLHLPRRRHIGQVLVLGNKPFGFGQRPQAVGGLKYIVGPGRAYLHHIHTALSPNLAAYGQREAINTQRASTGRLCLAGNIADAHLLRKRNVSGTLKHRGF